MSKQTEPGPLGGYARYKVESVHHALVLAQAFTRARPRMHAGEIARLLAISPARTAKIVATLMEAGLLSADEESQTFSLGDEWIRLSDIRKSQMAIREFALPVMREIQAITGETVTLNIAVGDRKISFEFVESSRSVEREAPPGYDAPLYAGASGHVLLAGMEPARIKDYIASTPLVPLSPETITAPAVLLRKLEEVRRLGYAISSGEVNAGISAVSAPIVDRLGKTVAALSISYPTQRFTAKLRQRSLECVIEGAQNITRQLRVVR